jgi:hypothetical protein
MNDRLDAALLDEAPDEVLIADIALDELGLLGTPARPVERSSRTTVLTGPEPRAIAPMYPRRQSLERSFIKPRRNVAGCFRSGAFL